MASDQNQSVEPGSQIITGMGLACPWGIGPGDSVLAADPQFSPSQDSDGAWRIPNEILAPDTRRIADLGGDRVCLLAVPAIRHALENAKLELAATNAPRVGLVLGSACAALPDMMHFAAQVKKQTPRFVSPLHFPQTVGNYAAGALAREFKINGPNLTFGQAPHVGLSAITEALRLLNAGWADVVLAGGADAASPNLLPAMIDAGLADPAGPFAAHPAEGACFFVLETTTHASARGATVLARLESAETSHEQVLSACLSGDPAHDELEVESARGQSPPPHSWQAVLSARHRLGNALAAASAAQLALAVAALCRNPVPLWHPQQTHRPERDPSPNTAVLDHNAIIVASSPVPDARRTLLRISHVPPS